MKRAYKVLLWVVGVVIGVALLILLLVSPVAKYVVESKSEVWIGRTIEIEKLRINLLTGRVNIRDLTLFEADRDSVFFHVDQLLVDINLWKLWSGVYQIEQLHIKDPFVHIYQLGDSMNFSDMLARFPADTSSKPAKDSSQQPVKYMIEDFSITGGNIRYFNSDFAADIEVVDMTLDIAEAKWDNPELGLTYSLSLASGGDVAGNFLLNQNTLEYSQKLTVDSLMISFILPYLKPYLKVSQLDGSCSLDLTIAGTTKDPYRSIMTGHADLRNFDLMGSKKQKELSFGHLSVALDSINTFQGFVNIGEVVLDSFYVREERYDSVESFSQLIIRDFNGYTPDGKAPDSAFVIASKSNPIILLVNFIKKVQAEVFIDSFSVDEVSVKNGVFQYTDHTLLAPENVTIDGLTLTVQDISSANCNAKGTFRTNVEHSGYIHAQFTFCPFAPYDFEATYQLKNIEVIHYNQYSIFYTDYPFKEGTLYYTGSISSKNKVMKMNNNIFIKKIYLGEKVENGVGKHLPMKLILAIVRDKEGNVSLEIPITGDLKDPKVNYWNLIGQALGNFFRKIFSSPSRQLAKEYGEETKFFKDLCFEKDQTELNKGQKRQLEKLVTVLTEKPQLVIDFQYVENVAETDSSLHKVDQGYEKRNRLIREYLSPFLDNPESRFTFSVKEEPGDKTAFCYELVYTVQK
ncbi:DUF748 domain-containing protein [Bacteroidota bacterium]